MFRARNGFIVTTAIGTLVLCLASTGFCHQVLANANCTNEQPGTQSASLCSIFQNIRSVIPENRLECIVRSHYKHDAQFRQALQFMHTLKFSIVTKQIEMSKVYKSTLQLFQQAGVNTTDISTISGIFNCLLIPLTEDAAADFDIKLVPSGGKRGKSQTKTRHQKRRVGKKHENSDSDEDEDEGDDDVEKWHVFEVRKKRGQKKHVVKNHHENSEQDQAAEDYDEVEQENEHEDENEDGEETSARSLTTFASQIMNAIPRKALRQELANEIANNTQFATFYRIVRSSGFRRQVTNNFSSVELKYPLSVLKQNYIDLKKLTLLGLKILSWGPKV